MTENTNRASGAPAEDPKIRMLLAALSAASQERGNGG